jgi:hypothetical protein
MTSLVMGVRNPIRFANNPTTIPREFHPYPMKAAGDQRTIIAIGALVKI